MIVIWTAHDTYQTRPTTVRRRHGDQIGGIQERRQQRHWSGTVGICPARASRGQAVGGYGAHRKYRRKHYAVPGVEILWKGYVRLAPTAQAVEQPLRLNQSSDVGKIVRHGPSEGRRHESCHGAIRAFGKR